MPLTKYATTRLRLSQLIWSRVSGALIIMALTAIISAYLGKLTHESFQWQQHSVAVDNTIDTVNIGVLSAESGVRGFAATGSEIFLREYENSLSSSRKQAAYLLEMTADNPEQNDQTGNLLSEIEQRAQTLGMIVDARKQADLGRMQEEMKRGLLVRQSIQQTIDSLKGREREVLASRQKNFLTLMILFLASTSVGGVGAIFLLLYGHRESRQQLLTLDALASSLRISEKAASERSKQLSSIVNSVLDGVITADSDGKIITWNHAAEKMFGFSEAESIGKSLSLIVSTEHAGEHDSYLKRYLTTGIPKLIGTTREVMGRRKDGSEIPVELSISVASDGGKTIFVGVTRDLTDQKAIAHEKVARAAAEAANRTKSEFLANMSHELRTPMGIIIGYSELLNSSSQVPEEQRTEYASAIVRNSKNLLALLNDILDLSKIDSGQVTIEKTSVLLGPFIADFINQERLIAAAKGLRLNCEVSTPLPETITTDPLRLRQILLNLVSNAIKFTEKGSVTIRISYRTLHDDCHGLDFEVSDSGCGLSKSKYESIFDPFTQADASVSRKYGGTGLGLGLSRKLARLLGGDVVLKSSREGEGSSFVATIIPGVTRQTHFLAAGIATRIVNAKPQSDVKNLETNDLPLLGRNILLVDDFEDNLALLTTCLYSVGAKTYSVTNGKDALEAFARQKFDAILMDIQMPVMNGYEATAALRSQDDLVPIIALTAHAMEEERKRCLQAGFSSYLSKPVSKDRLINSLETLINRHKEKIEVDDTVKQLRDLLSDPNFGPMVRDFASKLPLRAKAMRDFFQHSEWANLRTLAHQMRGAGGGYGMPIITTKAGQIEDQLREHSNAPGLDELVEEFEATCTNMSQLIESNLH